MKVWVKYLENQLNKSRLLTISEAFPTLTRDLIKGIFIKNQLDDISDVFSKVTVISLIHFTTIKSFIFKFLKEEHLPQNYSYKNVEVIYPRTLFTQTRNTRWITFDQRLSSIKKVINKNQLDFDLIHAHFGPVGHLIWPISKMYKKPLIVSFYGYDAYQHKYDSSYYQNLFDSVDQVLTLSDHMTARISKLGCPPKKIKKHHLGIDISKFKTKTQRLESKDDQSIKVLLVAHFTEKKGILDAIRAFSEVNKEYKNITFDIVGRGLLQDQIENLIKSLGLQNNVRITDNYSTSNPRQIVIDFMQNCDIFILPSITSQNGDSEGTPVVLMEASACGKPCITTFHSGNPEIVLNDKTGFVVPERDIEGLEKALNDLIINDDLRKQFGLNARNHILAEFNSKTQAEKLRQIYQEILI